jgi:hypothetical protein
MQQAQQRALATAVGTHQGNAFTGLHRQAYVTQSGHTTCGPTIVNTR